ncbi:hypothetical protein BJV74DRAFT_889753 [Russula compacta]|nr:hypothetical protein BJV74DRAFT_889753 [Russula compacta]
MSGVATSPTVQTTGSSTASHSSSQNNLAIIIVASIGGVLFIVALVLVLVPFARRRASRRQPKHTKSSTSSDGTSTTVHSRRDVHNRAISADASVPLLEPDPNHSTEYSRFRSITAQSNTATEPSTPHHSSTDSPPIPIPRRFATSFRSFSARPSPVDLESGSGPPSRSFLSSPPPPLRHARTRIARAPMDTLPEDSATDNLPQRGPSPTATTTESQAPSPTSWLHIPKASGMPLIGAFRGSISSLASAASSSLPTMQHYPSFNKTAQSATSASASSRSSQTFYTVASDGPTTGHDMGSPSEHGEVSPPRPPGSAARLKPSGVGERIPQVHLMNPPDGFQTSRQASMVYSHKSSMLSVAGPPRKGEDGRPLSGTVASGGSSLSLYSDARSQLGSGEDGRGNGSAGGSGGGARGRRS